MKTDTVLLILGGFALVLVLMQAMKPPPPPPPQPAPQNALSGLGSIVGAATGLAALF